MTAGQEEHLKESPSKQSCWPLIYHFASSSLIRGIRGILFCFHSLFLSVLTFFIFSCGTNGPRLKITVGCGPFLFSAVPPLCVFCGLSVAACWLWPLSSSLGKYESVVFDACRHASDCLWFWWETLAAPSLPLPRSPTLTAAFWKTSWVFFLFLLCCFSFLWVLQCGQLLLGLWVHLITNFLFW